MSISMLYVNQERMNGPELVVCILGFSFFFLKTMEGGVVINKCISTMG